MKQNLILLFTLFISTFTLAQRPQFARFDAGIMLGVTNYSGDVAESRIELAETRPGFGIFTRYHFSPQISLKAHAYIGSISGDDKNSKDLSRSLRSYRFGTSINEIGLVGEWAPFAKSRYSNMGAHQFRVIPYIYGGIGYTLADAKAEYYGPPDKRNDYLKVPLPEDGLNKNFILAPVGAGAWFDFSERFMIGLEGGIRPVFSDDLDGMRINGNPDSGDWYYFAGVTVSFILSDNRLGF